MESLIDPSFNLARDLKSFNFDETLLAALRLPTYYKADSQTPQLTWMVVTDHHLIFSGPKTFWQFRYSGISAIDLCKEKSGVLKIVIQRFWKTKVLRGYLGDLEDKLIPALQIAAQFISSGTKRQRSLVFANLFLLLAIMVNLGLLARVLLS